MSETPRTNEVAKRVLEKLLSCNGEDTYKEAVKYLASELIEHCKKLEDELNKKEIENIGFGYAIQVLRRTCGLESGESVDCSEVDAYIRKLQEKH